MDASAAPWDREVDLLVAGAGAGGMTAALVGSLEGLDVLVCESSQQVGGTAATSAGTIWIPGNTQSAAAGFDDTVERARTYLNALIGPRADNPVLDAFLATAAIAVDYLRERTDVQFVPCGRHPDYRSLPGAAVTGRALAPVPFDGRLLGAAFARVRPPIPEFLLFGGMMVGKEDIPRLVNRYRRVSNLLHAAKLYVRFRLDRLRHPRGTRIAMGNAFVARLFHSLRRRNVPVLFGARVRELLGDANGIAGALVECEGRGLRIRARRGVVLATGGLGHDRALRARFMPEPTPWRSLANATDVGDGLRMAESAGAALEALPPCGLWTPASVTRRRDGSEGLYPHLALDRAKPGVIAVNAAGRRFVDEGASYHDFVEAMFASHRSVPTIPAWLVCDARFIAKYGLGAILPSVRRLARFERSGYLVKAATPEALAAKLGIDAAGLRATIERFNAFAAKGEDPDFGKGKSEVCRFNGDATHTPNPCLAPLEVAPFYAVTVWPAEIATSSGIAANEHAQALDARGRPIAGLYVCGNDMASVMRGTYPGPGTTLGPALAFGYIAAMHAAHAQPVGVASAAAAAG
jgi:succinate dehydrogenase/fumarate reductase flavoprotein subunit